MSEQIKAVWPGPTALLFVAWTTLLTCATFADDDKIWELRASVGIRQSPAVKLSSSAQNLSAYGWQYDPAVVVPEPTGIGDASTVDARVYDNGFVGISRFGANPITTPGTPLTTYWGYQDAGQVQGDSIFFRASGDPVATLSSQSDVSPGSVYRNNDKRRILFPLLELSRLWLSDDGLKKYGITVGIFWFSQKERSPLTEVGRFSQEIAYVRKVTTDRYLHGGIVIPTAPYTGPESPPGPIIDNIPLSRTTVEETMSTEKKLFVESAASAFKMNLQSFSLGGTWRRKSDSPGSLQFDAGLALYRAKVRLSENSTLVDPYQGMVTDFNSSISGIKYRAGYYAAVGISWPIRKDSDISINIRGRYDGVNRANVRAGNTTASFNLSGWSLLLGLQKEF